MQHPYLDLNPHPILHLDAQGGCLYANPPGARLWKALSSDAEGLPPSWVTRVRTAMETGTPQNTLITAGGRIYTLHIVSHPQGEGVLCFGFETTELTQNTRRSIFQANLGRLISQISSRFINLEPQNLSAGITQVLHDLGEFLRARRAYIFQRDKTGRTFHNTHAWHAPQVQSLQETWQNLALSDYPYWWQALEKGTPILVPSVHNLPPEAQNEARALEKRGAHAAIAIPLAAHGHLLGFLGFDDPAEVQVWNPQAIEQLKTCAEIIASAILRQRSESALRNQRDFALLVMRTMGQGLTVTDPAGRMRYVNPAFARLLGYTPEALLNRPATSLVADDDLPTYQQALEQRRHGESTTYEITLKRKDGTRCPVLVTSVPYRRNNQIAGSIAVITDLSERKEVEALLRTQNQELERTRDQALEAARLKSEFLATMSHEIRTPMNSIIGMAELLLETNLDAQQKEFTTTIYQSTQALLDIVNDILDFSKIEAGELRLENAPFNPSALVEDIAETFSIQARQKSLSLMTFISPDVPSTLVGDERHLRRVLTSLVDNAVKFTEEGEINIQVQVISRDAHHTTLEYSVQDTGIGIPEALHQRIFQPFTQADGSLSRQYGGTGLGLAICKQIVEKMGGKIAFQSTAGKGTRFWFQVPLANAHSIEEEPPSPSTLTLEGKRILLVEDSHASRNIIRQYLENWGAHLLSLDSGLQVLDTLRQAAEADRPFHLALIDMRLPDTDGFTLAAKIQDEPTLENLPLILITAHDVPGQAEQALQAGFKAYITKPIRKDTLLDTLQNVLHIQPTQTASPTESGEIVLVVEDNPANQKMVLLQLKALGYPAYAVDNAASGIRELLENGSRYALVLMDVQMPEMDGLTATRKIRELEAGSGRHIPIIALTANAMAGDRERCLQAGMDDYLSKPLKKAALQAALEKWYPPDKRPQPPAPTAAPPPEQSPTPQEDSTDLLDPATLETLRQLEASTEPGLLKEIYGMYLLHSVELMGKIRNAVFQKDAEALRQSAHSLKGSSMEIGAHKLGAVCAELEKIGRSGDTASADARIPELQDLYDSTCRAIRSLLDDMA